jgi:hypothetical protein
MSITYEFKGTILHPLIYDTVKTILNNGVRAGVTKYYGYPSLEGDLQALSFDEAIELVGQSAQQNTGEIIKCFIPHPSGSAYFSAFFRNLRARSFDLEFTLNSPAIVKFQEVLPDGSIEPSASPDIRWYMDIFLKMTSPYPVGRFFHESDCGQETTPLDQFIIRAALRTMCQDPYTGAHMPDNTKALLTELYDNAKAYGYKLSPSNIDGLSQHPLPITLEVQLRGKPMSIILDKASIPLSLGSDSVIRKRDALIINPHNAKDREDLRPYLELLVKLCDHMELANTRASVGPLPHEQNSNQEHPTVIESK